MKNKSLIVTVFVLVAVIALAAAVYPSLAEKAVEATTAEQTSIADTVQYKKYTDIRIFDENGNEVKLSDFEGRPMILNFWATWCGYCIYEMPDFEAAYKEYGDEIQFLMVNTDDGIGIGEDFIETEGYTFPTYYDLQFNAAVTYGISGIPRTIAIDAEGNIRYNRSGMIGSDTLQSIIDMIK